MSTTPHTAVHVNTLFVFLNDEKDSPETQRFLVFFLNEGFNSDEMRIQVLYIRHAFLGGLF